MIIPCDYYKLIDWEYQ